MKNFYWLIVAICLFSSCESLKETSKYQFVEGYYKVPVKGKTETLYVLTGSDTIKAFRKSDITAHKMDTSHTFLFAFPSQIPKDFKSYVFKRNTFDFDVLTVLFKYRFPVSGFPPQLNASFNGALYLGYRTDFYRLSYKTSPLHYMKRSITHFGYSTLCPSLNYPSV